MRQNFAAVVVLCALLGVAGCSDRAASPGVAAAPDPVVPSVVASLAAPDGETGRVCARAARAGTAFGETFIADLRLQIDAGQGAGPRSRAERKIARDVQDYSSALAGMAKRTTDPVLKKALTRMSRQVTALKGDLTKINTDELSALTATLGRACGQG